MIFVRISDDADTQREPGIRMGLLPVSGAALRADARVREAARDIGTRYGVDYTDDAAVTALLTERRKSLETEQRRPAAYLGLLTLMAGMFLPFGIPLSPALDAHLFAVLGAAGGGGPRRGPARTRAGPMEARTAQRPPGRLPRGPRRRPRPRHPARAHTAVAGGPDDRRRRRRQGRGADPDVPAGATGTGGPHGDHDGTLALGHRARPAPVPVPPKPWAVSHYEHTADAGGWHDEVGCLLVLAGGGGVTWAVTVGTGVGYAALLLVPVAVWVWLAGRRQGREKEELREQALKYVKELEAAQAAGARVPELSRSCAHCSTATTDPH